MMRYVVYIFLCLLCACNKSDLVLPNSRTGIKVITKTGAESIQFAKKTKDGGAIFGGSANYAPFLLKVDSQGNEEWFSNAGYAGEEIFYDIAEAVDGSLSAVGLGASQLTPGAANGYIAHFSAKGELEWQYLLNLDTPQNEALITVGILKNGNILCSGPRVGKSDLITRSFLYCFNNVGEIVWKEDITEFMRYFNARSLIVTQSNDIVIEGFYRLGGILNSGFMILDEFGTLKFKTLVKVEPNDALYGSNLQETQDGYSWLNRIYTSRDKFTNEIVNVHLNGTLINVIPLEKKVNGFVTDESKSLLFYGSEQGNLDRKSDFIVTKFDATGNEQWISKIGNNENLNEVLLIQSFSKYYMIYGKSLNELNNNTSFIVYRISNNGELKYYEN